MDDSVQREQHWTIVTSSGTTRTSLPAMTSQHTAAFYRRHYLDHHHGGETSRDPVTSRMTSRSGGVVAVRLACLSDRVWLAPGAYATWRRRRARRHDDHHVDDADDDVDCDVVGRHLTPNHVA